ncbi:hypothetical protein F2Q70_00036639 [Brassica cretica]|uniref:F-box/LRR-repeat protein 15/At3g58940/PEG3-like LRR domain-containing protein n=1 Tax=Brassica cretica TaxID=69181 RepID=A0A8S9JYC0_BRACR|nr:hypothetical protein F2Q70_00036639 [Brassica cretica]
MSILSKGWLSLWTLVPRVIFDEECNENHAIRSLSQFVSGTLLLHKAAVLKFFHLNIVLECSSSQIGLWVRITFDLFVRDLKISFYHDHSLVMLPSRLFRCKTLETLEFYKVIILDIPSSQFSFHSLMKLHLLSVVYSDGESFCRLISNCPVLQELVVEICHQQNVVTFTVDLPSLKNFSVGNTIQENPPDDHLFVIRSQSLKRLRIVDYFGQLDLIGILPKLVDANFNLFPTMPMFWSILPSSCILNLLISCIQARYPRGTVLFQLLRLELCSCDDSWTNMLVSLLQHFPKLQPLKHVLAHFL